jgi:polyhydroxyalkanoate synthesis regulator phasin
MNKDKPLTLEELAEFFRSEIVPRFEKLEAGQSRLEAGQQHLSEEMKELKAELANTPSRREFEELKHRVDRLERAN